LSRPRCLILAGPIGSGKTSGLGALLRAFSSEGRRIAAVLQPDTGRGPDRVARGFEMEFLSSAGGVASGALSSERIALARELPDGPASSGPLGADEFALGHFLFEAAAFRRAEAFVRAELAAAALRGGLDALGLDEIGSLELKRKEGLWPCLDLALASAAAGSGPSLLVCASRDSNAGGLRDLAAAAGLEVEIRDIAVRIALRGPLFTHSR
jgi:hypothetical protein